MSTATLDSIIERKSTTFPRMDHEIIDLSPNSIEKTKKILWLSSGRGLDDSGFRSFSQFIDSAANYIREGEQNGYPKSAIALAKMALIPYDTKFNTRIASVNSQQGFQTFILTTLTRIFHTNPYDYITNNSRAYVFDNNIRNDGRYSISNALEMLLFIINPHMLSRGFIVEDTHYVHYIITEDEHNFSIAGNTNGGSSFNPFKEQYPFRNYINNTTNSGVSFTKNALWRRLNRRITDTKTKGHIYNILNYYNRNDRTSVATYFNDAHTDQEAIAVYDELYYYISNYIESRYIDNKALLFIKNIFHKTFNEHIHYNDINTVDKLRSIANEINDGSGIENYYGDDNDTIEESVIRELLKNESDPTIIADMLQYHPKFVTNRKRTGNREDISKEFTRINAKLDEFQRLPGYNMIPDRASLTPAPTTLQHFKVMAMDIANKSTLSKQEYNNLTGRISSALSHREVYELVKDLNKSPYTHQTDYADIKSKYQHISSERTVKNEIKRQYELLYDSNGAKPLVGFILDTKNRADALKRLVNTATAEETVYREVLALLNEVGYYRSDLYHEINPKAPSADKAKLDQYKQRLLDAKREIEESNRTSAAINKLNEHLTKVGLPDRASIRPFILLPDFKNLAIKALNKYDVNQQVYTEKSRLITEANNYTDVVNQLDGLNKAIDTRNSYFAESKNTLDRIPGSNNQRSNLLARFNELYTNTGLKEINQPAYLINQKAESLINDLRDVWEQEEHLRNENTKSTIQSKIDALEPAKRREYVQTQFDTLKRKQSLSRSELSTFLYKVNTLTLVSTEYKSFLSDNSVREFDAFVSANSGKPETQWTRGLVSHFNNAEVNNPYTESHVNIDNDIANLREAKNRYLANTTAYHNAMRRYVDTILNDRNIVKLAKKEAGYTFTSDSDEVGSPPNSNTKTYLEKLLPAIATEESYANITNFTTRLVSRYNEYVEDQRLRGLITQKLNQIRHKPTKDGFQQDYNVIYNWKYSDNENGNTSRPSSGIDSADMPPNQVFSYTQVRQALISLLNRIEEEIRLQDSKPVLDEQLKRDVSDLINSLKPDNRKQFYLNEYNRLVNDRFTTDDDLRNLKNNITEAKQLFNDIKDILLRQVEPELLKYSPLNRNVAQGTWNRQYPAYHKTQDYYNRLEVNTNPARTVNEDLNRLRTLKNEVIGSNAVADALKHFKTTVLNNNAIVRLANKEVGWQYRDESDLLGTPPSPPKETILDVISKELVTLSDSSAILNKVSQFTDKFNSHQNQQRLREEIKTEIAKLRDESRRNPLNTELRNIRDWLISEPEEGGTSIVTNTAVPPYNINEINTSLENLLRKVRDKVEEQRQEDIVADNLRRKREEVLAALDASGLKPGDAKYQPLSDEINRADNVEELDRILGKINTIKEMLDKHKRLSNQIKYIEGDDRKRHHQTIIDGLKSNLVLPVTDSRWTDAENKITEAINANNLYLQIKDLVDELGSADIVVRETESEIPSAGRNKLTEIRDRLVKRKEYLRDKTSLEKEVEALNTGNADKDSRFKRDIRSKITDNDTGNHAIDDYVTRTNKLRDLRQELNDYKLQRDIEKEKQDTLKRNVETRLGFVLGEERRQPLSERLLALKSLPTFNEEDWQALADTITDRVNGNGVYTEIERLIAELGETHPKVIEVKPRIANASYAELIEIRTTLHGLVNIKRKKEYLHQLTKRVQDALIRTDFNKRIDTAEDLNTLLALEAEIQNEIQLNFLRKEAKQAILNLPASENLRAVLDNEERQAKTREALIDIRNRALRRKQELDVLESRKPKKPRTPLTPTRQPSVPKVKQYHYDFDPTGRDKRNLITNERHTITVENRTPQNVLIPGFSPFFRRSLVVRDMSSGFELIEGIDYIVVWPIDVTPDTEDYTPLYGGIQFIDEALTGQFEIDYQTIGGQFALDGVQIAQALANQANDPLTTTFESLIGRPIKLPPLEHVHGIEDFVGFDDLTNSVLSLRDAIELLAREDAENHPGYDTLIDAYFRLLNEMKLYKQTVDGLSNKLTDEVNRIADSNTAAINNFRIEINNSFAQLQNNVNDDLANLRRELTQQINQFQTTVNQTINTFKQETTADLNGLRELINREVAGLTQKLNTAKNDLEGKLIKLRNDLTGALDAYKRTNDAAVQQLGTRLTTLTDSLAGRVAVLEGKPANRITDNNGKLQYNGKVYLNTDDLNNINSRILQAANAGADWNTNLRNIPGTLHYSTRNYVRTTANSGQWGGMEVISDGRRFAAEVDPGSKRWKLLREATDSNSDVNKRQEVYFPITPGVQLVVYKSELDRELQALRTSINGVSSQVGNSLQSTLNRIEQRLTDLERRVTANEGNIRTQGQTIGTVSSKVTALEPKVRTLETQLPTVTQTANSAKSIANSANTTANDALRKATDLEPRVRVNEQFRESITFEF